MTCRQVTQIDECLLQDRKQHMDPLGGIRLRHLEHRAVRDLEGCDLEIAEDKQQALLGRGQGRVDIAGIRARSTRFTLHGPIAHMPDKRRFKRRYQLLELING